VQGPHRPPQLASHVQCSSIPSSYAHHHLQLRLSPALAPCVLPHPLRPAAPSQACPRTLCPSPSPATHPLVLTVPCLSNLSQPRWPDTRWAKPSLCPPPLGIRGSLPAAESCRLLPDRLNVAPGLKKPSGDFYSKRQADSQSLFSLGTLLEITVRL